VGVVGESDGAQGWRMGAVRDTVRVKRGGGGKRALIEQEARDWQARQVGETASGRPAKP
jgi:hypothetical protein